MSPDMNTQAMNHDPHSPVFIRGKASPDKQTKASAPPTRSIDWRCIIELALLLALVVGYCLPRLEARHTTACDDCRCHSGLPPATLRRTNSPASHLHHPWLPLLASHLRGDPDLHPLTRILPHTLDGWLALRS